MTTEDFAPRRPRSYAPAEAGPPTDVDWGLLMALAERIGVPVSRRDEDGLPVILRCRDDMTGVVGDRDQLARAPRTDPTEGDAS